MGDTPDLEATATLQTKLRRALALTLIVATASVVGSQNISGRYFFAAPVAADSGGEVATGQSSGSSAVGGNFNSFSADDFESAIGGRYGGFDVAILDSRGIETNNSGYPIIVVDVAIRNSTDRQLRLPESMFGLQADTGRVIPIERFEYTDHSTRLIIEPGLIQTATLVVRLPPLLPAEPDLYRLHVAVPFREPLLLPIHEADDHTQPEGVDTGAEVAIELSPTSNLKVLELASTYNHRAYRSRIDHHLVTLTVDLTPGPDSTVDHIADPRWWRLETGDQQLTAATVEVSKTAASSVRATIVFEPPASALQLTLVAGPTDAGATLAANLTLVAPEPQ